MAPRRADRVDGAVRAVVRDAARATEGDGAAQRPGRRRAAGRLRALPVRVPPGAAGAAAGPCIRRRGVGGPRRAPPVGEAPPLRSPPGAADRPVAALRVHPRARTAPPPAFADPAQGATG